MLPIQCAGCINYKKSLKCAAFPDRIPEDILTVRFDHSEPYKGDHGIRFEPAHKG